MNGVISIPASVPTTALILTGKATLLLTLIFILRFLMKNSSASTRFFVTGAGIIMIGCLPILAWVMPEWKLPVPIVIQPSIVSKPSVSQSSQTTPETVQPTSPEVASSRAETKAPRAATGGSSLLYYVWFMGTAVALGRVLLGVVGNTRRRHRVEEHNPVRIHELVRKLSDRVGLQRTVCVRVGGRAAVPHVGGIITPVLYLPQTALDWPDQQLTSVVLHELAHIKRRDHLLWPLANLAASWLWFNPLVWLALAQLRKDKERACDDYVVACGCNRITYARHLLGAFRSLKTSAMLAPVSVEFARKNEITERIVYMLNKRMDRRPISRPKRLAVVSLFLFVLVPLIGITGFSSALAPGSEVSPEEQKVVVSTLKSFYAALTEGADFEATSEEFLTSNYFEDSSLTKNLENSARLPILPVFENTTCCITAGRPGVVQKVRTRITSVQRDGDELVATLQLDIAGFCLDKRNLGRDANSDAVFVPDKASNKKTAIRECPVVDSLSQQIRFRREDNAWRISQFKGGVTLMRMVKRTDTCTHGPIFLVWINDIDKRTTPSGSNAFKVTPQDVVPDAHNAEFVLEQQR